MSTYKITNITNFLGKRDFKFNSPVDVEYVDNMMKKALTVKPGDSVFLTVPILPLSVHRLRVKNLITVVEVGESELITSLAEAKPKKRSAKKVEEALVSENDEAEKKQAKRKGTKRETEE